MRNKGNCWSQIILISAAVLSLLSTSANAQLGAYVRHSQALQAPVYGNYSFQLTPADSDDADANQIVGLAFGNDRDNSGAKRAPTRQFEYVDRTFLQIRFNKAEAGKNSAILEFYQGNNQLIVQNLTINPGTTKDNSTSGNNSDNSNNSTDPASNSTDNGNSTNVGNSTQNDNSTENATNPDNSTTVDNSTNTDNSTGVDNSTSTNDTSAGDQADPMPGDNDFGGMPPDMDMHHRRLQEVSTTQDSGSTSDGTDGNDLPVYDDTSDTSSSDDPAPDYSDESGDSSNGGDTSDSDGSDGSSGEDTSTDNGSDDNSNDGANNGGSDNSGGDDTSGGDNSVIGNDNGSSENGGQDTDNSGGDDTSGDQNGGSDTDDNSDGGDSNDDDDTNSGGDDDQDEVDENFSIYGTPQLFTVAISGSQLLIVYNNTEIVFNSTEYDLNSGRLLQSGGSSASIQSTISSLPSKVWPYLAAWTTSSNSSSPLSLSVSQFSYSSNPTDGSAPVTVNDSFTDLSSWTSATLVKSPFFLQATTSSADTPFSGSSVSIDSAGLKLLVRDNSLSTSQAKWYTSSSYFVLTQTNFETSSDQDSVSFDASFDSLPAASISSSEIVTDIDIIRANYVYKLNGCFQITTNQTASGGFPMNVYLRQKQYPFKKITNVQTITVDDTNMCGMMELRTIDAILSIDLKDYASLVFDVAPDQSSNLYNFNGGIHLSLTSLKLVGTTKPTQQKPDPVVKENIFQQMRQIIEGWSDKLNSANIGFGIVIALILVSILAGCILFGINQKRLSQQRLAINNLKQEDIELDKQILTSETQLGTIVGGKIQNMVMMSSSPEQQLQQVRTGLEEVQVSEFNSNIRAGKLAHKGAEVPIINLNNLNNVKDSPMIIDDSQVSPGDKQDFAEYEYHSAGKPGQAPAIETSMQSYSRGIARHLGSAQKSKKKQDDHIDTEESHDKDDIVTNGYPQGTNRPDQQF